MSVRDLRDENVDSHDKHVHKNQWIFLFSSLEGITTTSSNCEEREQERENRFKYENDNLHVLWIYRTVNVSRNIIFTKGTSEIFLFFFFNISTNIFFHRCV